MDRCAYCRKFWLRSRWSKLVLQEVAQSGVVADAGCIGSTCSEGQSADCILRDQIVLQLTANIKADTHGVTALRPANRVLELVEIFTASLREVLIRTKCGRGGANAD